MGSVVVDQIGPDGALVADVDRTLRESEKNALLLEALPGARVATYAGQRVVRFGDDVILKKQVTHLGNPWPAFKKRIQIPNEWLAAARQTAEDNLRLRFVGIYHYGEVTIFVDFDPQTYLSRKANNSAAHVSTNDLFQAQTLGQFSRVDRNGNRLTSVRSDRFAAYLAGVRAAQDRRLECFERFNTEFLRAGRVEALDAVQQMHAALWPDRYQAEWPGFYLEFKLDSFLRSNGLQDSMDFQKSKRRGLYDYDLVFKSGPRIDFYGDLKASDIAARESPGNDARDLGRCVREFGRFWYVVYEHDTLHSRNRGNLATIAWNEWRRSVGYVGSKEFNPLSYAGRFKESVDFRRMFVLEVNPANFGVVLGDFNQGKQPDGAARAVKVMINKRNIDNFLIYSQDVATISGH